MNLNEMQNAWNSPQNRLAPHQEQLAANFARQMIRRRRFQAIWLGNVFVAMSVITALAARSIALGKVDATEWALVPLLLVPWGFAIFFLKRFLSQRNPAKPGELAVADSLRTALASNLQSQNHLKWAGALYGIFIPVLALAIHQLHAAGKVSGRELVSMAAFFAGALLVGGTVVALRFFLGLRPQEKQLRGLIRDLAAESA